MALIIRPAAPGDAQALTTLAHASKRHWGYPEAWIEAWREALTLTPAYLSRHRVYAGRVGDELAAFYALEEEGGAWTMAHFWVGPEWMGRGIGRWMFYDAMRRLRELGPGVLRIASDPHAEGFYLRMGCRRAGAVPAGLPGADRELPLLEVDAATWEEPLVF